MGLQSQALISDIFRITGLCYPRSQASGEALLPLTAAEPFLPPFGISSCPCMLPQEDWLYGIPISAVVPATRAWHFPAPAPCLYPRRGALTICAPPPPIRLFSFSHPFPLP